MVKRYVHSMYLPFTTLCMHQTYVLPFFFSSFTPFPPSLLPEGNVCLMRHSSFLFFFACSPAKLRLTFIFTLYYLIPPLPATTKLIRMTLSNVLIFYLYKIETFIAFLNSFLNHIILMGIVILLKYIISMGSVILLNHVILMGSIILLVSIFLLISIILIMTILN